MWRRLGCCVVPLALAAALAPASPASAQLAPPNNPLPGSTFQGADGNQDDATPYFDWQTLQATGRVRHSPDPNAADSAFTGGSKELEPGEWGLTTESGGVNPGKDNILDAWSAVDQPGANTFAYLGFTREDSVGTTFLTFELNHDDRLWNNGRADIPCRRTGDVQISYEPHGSDPEVDVVIRRWKTTQAHAPTGCATRGELTTVTTLPAGAAQAAMNASPITSRLPGTLTGTIGARLFGETALNLTELLEKAFGEECMAFNSVWMHTRSSIARASFLRSSNMQDYVAPQSLRAWTCTASGTKFFDSNANGERDDGDPGIPRFVIWADYNNNGVRDDDEPFSVSDNSGRYVIHDIKPPNGIYRLREGLLRRRTRALPVARDWQCSYPNDSTPGGTGSAPNGRFQCGWGPIDVNASPNVQGRDFGNWFPARLTVRKRLVPASDPGRFDLLVNGQVVVPAAGDRARRTLSVPPGTYTVSERAVAGTDPAVYDSMVYCRRNETRFARPQATTVFAELALLAGEQGSCTFFNVRPGVPAIAISKRGPAIATAGDTLQYGLQVTNPGDIPFPEADVRVTDPQCDDRPELVSKEGDATPGTLDPGDTWNYSCSRATASGGATCEPTRVPNTATVTGTVGGSTVTDEDAIDTILLCPPTPIPPIPPTPGPDPGPVVPPGPRPPDADDAGLAGVVFRRSIEGCIGRRVPRVNLRGARIASVRIYVNGRLVRGLTLDVLQRRERPRVTLAAGQRYRIRVRVTFQLGSGTPPVTLTGAFRTCARPPTACPSAGAASERGARIACASSAVVRRWRRPT